MVMKACRRIQRLVFEHGRFEAVALDVSDDGLWERVEMTYIWMEWLSRNSLHSDASSILDDDFVYLGVAHKVKVGVYSSGGVNIGVGCVTTSTGLMSRG
jgi:hypothetical protein